MTPSVSAEEWFETGADPIDDDLDLAVLMARIGMASNALSTHLEAASAAHERQPPGNRRPAKDARDLFVSLATGSAVLCEAIELAGREMPLLRVLAQEGGASEDLFKRIGKLRAGKHPASAMLARSRNRLSFHWDKEEITPSVKEFAKNKKLIWVELDHDERGVYVFAMSVLMHALFPEAHVPGADTRRLLNEGLANLSDAVGVVNNFFAKVLFGYLLSYGAERKRRGDLV